MARLSASATAHRLVAQESMHCSGRYSGTGVQVFSALPVVQQRAQVDIGQKSGILQMKHAPTALTCHGGPRRSSTICGVEGVAKPGSAPVASRILRYQPYTGLDPLLPRIRTVCAIPALPSISCDDGTHLCPACPAHAHPPTPLRPITVLEQHFNHLNFASEPQPHATAQMPIPIPRDTLQHARHIHYADDMVVLLPRTPMHPALLCLIFHDARSHYIHVCLSFLLPPHLL